MAHLYSPIAGELHPNSYGSWRTSPGREGYYDAVEDTATRELTEADELTARARWQASCLITRRRRQNRQCVACGKPEKVSRSTGIPLTNLAPYSGVCVDCINKAIKSR